MVIQVLALTLLIVALDSTEMNPISVKNVKEVAKNVKVKNSAQNVMHLNHI